MVAGRRDGSGAERRCPGAASPQVSARRRNRGCVLRSGFSVVVQDVVLGPALLEYTKLIRSRPLCVVVLAPTADVVRAREAARAKSAYGAGGFGVEELDAALRGETPRIGLWIDSSA